MPRITPGANFPVPTSTLDLIQNRALFEKFYPPDFFYPLFAEPRLIASGKEWAGEKSGRDERFLYGGDITLVPSARVAIHPGILDDATWHETMPEVRALRNFFHAHGRENYPTFGEVRKSTGYGAGAALLSAGAFLFAARENAEDGVFLWQRTGFRNSGRAEEFSGIANSLEGPAYQLASKLAFTGERDHVPVYEVPITLNMPARQAAMIKHGQWFQLAAESVRLGLPVGTGIFPRRLETLDAHDLGLPVSSLFVSANNLLAPLSFQRGVVGYETATHTVTIRSFYRTTAKTLIDSEGRQRVATLYTREQLREKLGRDKMFALCSASAILGEIMECGWWPCASRPQGLGLPARPPQPTA